VRYLRIAEETAWVIQTLGRGCAAVCLLICLTPTDRSAPVWVFLVMGALGLGIGELCFRVTLKLTRR